MNLNPLLKLDGYYFFTETIGIPDLKERSTAFVSDGCGADCCAYRLNFQWCLAVVCHYL